MEFGQTLVQLAAAGGDGIHADVMTVCAAEVSEKGREVEKVGVAVADEEDVHGGFLS
jgi:hypothetical protein